MNDAEIPLIRGKLPLIGAREFQELMLYESGEAEGDAAIVQGTNDEPWLNVLQAYEPGSPPALEQLLADSVLGPCVHGRVADLGAGTCWATARLSKVERIQQIAAVDLSEGFLRSVGTRVIRRLEGDSRKIQFAASTFEELPFADGHFDCVLMIASIHHSLAPFRVLIEARRVLRPGGWVMLIESAGSILRINRFRAERVEVSRGKATEIAYTRGELVYFLQHAGFAAIRCQPVDALTKSPIKLAVRRILRLASLEPVFLGTLSLIAGQAPARP